MFTLGAFYLTIVYGVIALLGDSAFVPSALVYVGLLNFQRYQLL